MKKYNCIVVFNNDENQLLFCKRTKDPYKGLYNFVGGKVEAGEESDFAAYRELQEETGIAPSQIVLRHFMDLTYYFHDLILELYVGKLEKEVNLIPEINPLEWLSAEEDFTDRKRFAGEQNIAHIVNVAKDVLLQCHEASPVYDTSEAHVISKCMGPSIGVDGCKGGWITAVLTNGNLTLKRYETISAILSDYPDFGSFLIDMAIGLPSSAEEQRPDGIAKKLLGPRASTIFPIPCRQAVIAASENEQKLANMKIMHKSLSKQTTAIIPKIKELDEYLLAHAEYQNVIKESHPEVCFLRLNSQVLMSKKSETSGMEERKKVLVRYCKAIEDISPVELSKKLECRPDDILDAICMAVTADLDQQGKTETIPEQPQKDEKGLLMRMVIPG